LKTLTREEARLIQSQTRLVNQLTACLKSYYPVALTLFEPAPAAFQRSPSSKPTRPLRPQHKPPRKTFSYFSSRQSIGV
jgi:hypothetical protein